TEGRREAAARRSLRHNQRILCQPPASKRGGNRLFRQSMPIGRISKDKLKRLHGAKRPEIGRVTPEDAGASLQAKPFDILADQRPRRRILLHEQAISSPPRDGFNAKGS